MGTQPTTPTPVAETAHEFRTPFKQIALLASYSSHLLTPFNSKIENAVSMVEPKMTLVANPSKPQVWALMFLFLFLVSIPFLAMSAFAGILFLPITLPLTILAGFFGGMVTPFAVALTWCFLVSSPMQQRLDPYYNRLLNQTWAQRLLLENNLKTS